MSNMNVQKTSDLTNLMQTYYEKRLLDKLRSKFHFADFAMKQKLRKNSGKVVRWNRYSDLSVNTTALTEGVSPDGDSLESNIVDATVAGYGRFVTISDFIEMTAISSVMNEAVDLLGYDAGRTADALTRNEVDTNGNQRYTDPANNSSKANVQSGSDVLKASDIRLAAKALAAADVEPWEDGLYRGIIHPIMEFDLLGDTTSQGFIQLVANTDASDQRKGKIGDIYGVKLFRSAHVRADATSTNVYMNPIVGKNAYGTVDLDGGSLQLIVKQLGSGADPLNQRATVGYKFYTANKVLDADRIAVINAYGA